MPYIVGVSLLTMGAGKFAGGIKSGAIPQLGLKNTPFAASAFDDAIDDASGAYSGTQANGASRIGSTGSTACTTMGANKAGLTSTQVEEITSAPKGARPEPISYLSTEYINEHLSKFDNGVTKIVPKAPLGTAGPPNGTFVLPSSVADDLIAQANGDVSKLEQLLGLSKGTLGLSPSRVDIPNPSGLRMPSGNELGANEFWLPGGYTSGNLIEAVIDSPLVGQYTVKPIN